MEPVDAEFFTGRSAYLCDPESNYFEIVWADMPDNPVVIAARRAAGLSLPRGSSGPHNLTGPPTAARTSSAIFFSAFALHLGTA